MITPSKILIVDDEPNVRSMFRTTIESSGSIIVNAVDGESALQELAVSSFDLVLLDLRMPGIDGMETLRRLRQQNNHTPVIIITAHGDVPHAVEAMKLGAVDFLSKPVTPDTLRHIVAEVCERSQLATTCKTLPVIKPELVTAESQFSLKLAQTKLAVSRCDFHEAEIHLKQALALKNDSAEAHNLMGVLLELRNDHVGS